MIYFKMAHQDSHIVSRFRCVYWFFIFSFILPCGGQVELYKNYTVNGWTVPVCRLSSLCRTDESCSPGISYKWLGDCHCDPYCFYFNDCCIDYLNECNTNVVDDSFIKATEGIDQSQFTCEQPDGNPQYEKRYRMVSRCDVRWSNEEIRSKCEEQATNEDSLTALPVLYFHTITFKNVYCAVCNYRNISAITPWQIEATCLSKEFSNLSRSVFSAQQVGDVMRDCPIWNFSTPFSSTTRRRCRNSKIESCAVGVENQTMVALAQACESYKGLFGIFRNPHCFMCHLALTYNETMETIYFNLIYIRCPLYPTSPSINIPFIPSPNYPISVLFDFSSVEGLSSQEPQNYLLCRNDQIYDQVNEECVSLTCPTGYSLMNGTCQRLPVNLQCSIENKIPVLTEVDCTYDVNDTSNCQPDMFLQDYVMSIISDSYVSSMNFTVRHFLAEIKGTNSSKICTQTLSISGYLGTNVDVSKENLDRLLLSQGHQSSGGNDLCSNMTFKISVGCGNLNESCPHRIISQEKFTKSHDNTSGQVFFVGETKYSLVESLYIIKYDIISPKMNSKQEILLGCEVPPETCTLVLQNISLFEDLNNGSYLYFPLNRTLAANEYLEDGNDTIFICSSVLEGGLSFTGFLRFNSAQSIISTIGISLSIIALILTFITYLKFNLLRKATPNVLIISFCVCLILAQCLILFGGLAAMNSIVCLSFAILGHYVWIAVFSHTTSLAFDLHRRFGIASKFGPTDEGAGVLSRFLLFAWGCPVLVVIPCLGIFFSDANIPHFSLTYKTLTCWIGDGRANLYVFGIPVALLVFINLILFIMVIAGLRQRRMSPVQKHKSTDSGISSDLVIYVKMSTLLGFTWIFGFVAGFADVTALWYIFIILTSLQGVYIFIAFICNKRVLELWSESCKCLERISSASSSKSKATSSDVVTVSRSKGKMTDRESVL